MSNTKEKYDAVRQMLEKKECPFAEKVILLSGDYITETGFLMFRCFKTDYNHGYLIHYDVIDAPEKYRTFRIGKYNHFVMDDATYEAVKEKIPDDFGIHIVKYTEKYFTNGRICMVGHLEKIKSSKSVEGLLSGIDELSRNDVEKMFGLRRINIPFECYSMLENGAASFETIKHPYIEYKAGQSFIKDLKKVIHEKGEVKYNGECKILMEHQKAGALIASRFDHYGFFYDTGTGKTLLALEIIAKKSKENKAHFLIICPKTIVNTAWMDDCSTFFPKMKMLPLTKDMDIIAYRNVFQRWREGGSLEKEIEEKLFRIIYVYQNISKTRQAMIECADHYIINPEAFRKAPQDYLYYQSNGLLGRCETKIDGVIIDESSMLKNMHTKTFKQIRKNCVGLKYLYLLSGKPAPNRVDEYASQMYIISPDVYNQWERKRPPKNNPWITQKEYNHILLKYVKLISITVSKEDCMNLPDTTDMIRSITLSKHAKDAYDYVKHTTWQAIRINNQNDRKANDVFFVLGNIMKLREVASGFLKKEDSSGTSLEVIHDAKLNELVEVVHELGDSQAIIWCQFKYDIERINNKLTKLGYTVRTAYGETKNKDKSIYDFRDGKAQFLIANPKTLQYGVTLVNCTYAIYYSLSYSFEEYYQSHDRIYRKGQDKSCTFIFLLSKNTIDEIMYEAVMKKLTNSQFAELVLKHVEESYSNNDE